MSNQQNFYSQLEHLQSKYVGTGHPDIARHEWAVNQHRDSLASYLGHQHMVDYLALAEGHSTARVRANLLAKMHAPCGVETPVVRKRRLGDVDLAKDAAESDENTDEDRPDQPGSGAKRVKYQNGDQ